MQHQAVEQMLGYVYQIYYALKLLLDSDDDEDRVCVERFDDVSVSHTDGSFDYAQLKLHQKTAGDLSDYSVDFWKTLRVWIDAINNDHEVLTKTTFLLITTSSPAAGSAVKAMTDDTPNYDEIYRILKSVAESSTNETTAKARGTFLNLCQEDAITLLSHVQILNDAPNVEGVIASIKKIIKNGCRVGSEQQVYLRLIGWWNDLVVQGLSNDTPLFISKLELRRKLSSIISEYTEDNLPIDIPRDFSHEPATLGPQLFEKQIELISHTESTLSHARRDYYRAYEQRSRWVRDCLINIDDLEAYDEKLTEEWERKYDSSSTELLGLPMVEEKDLQKQGRALYNSVMDSSIHIRAKCTTPFVMRGSYQLLADRLAVGWHRDYIQRLTAVETEDSEEIQ